MHILYHDRYPTISSLMTNHQFVTKVTHGEHLEDSPILLLLGSCYSMFSFLCSLQVDTSAREILVSDGIIVPVVSASALTRFIIYIYVCINYLNLQFLNNVVIDKTKVLLPHVSVTLADSGYPVQALWFYSSQHPKLFGFPICRFWAYLMKVIPETRRAHYNTSVPGYWYSDNTVM